jgi:hypothetical protein
MTETDRYGLMILYNPEVSDGVAFADKSYASDSLVLFEQVSVPPLSKGTGGNRP